MGCLRLVDRWRYKWSSELRVVHGKKAVTSNDWVKRVRSSYFFGMLMPDRHDEINGNPYTYGFNGMERDEEVKGAGNSYDFGARMQDPRLGRWLSIDPLADKMPAWSTYSFSFDNPILYLDSDGRFPIAIHVRSFAPFKFFGFGLWHGDNRGFSTSPNVTSRIRQVTAYETETQVATTKAYGGFSGTIYGAGAYSEAYLNGGQQSVTTQGNNINTHLYGNNDALLPAIPPSVIPPDGGPTWDIDVHSDLTVDVVAGENGNQILNITGSISGDAFPSAEAFVTDADGNSVFLNVSPAAYGGNYGPSIGLAGDNERPMFDVNTSIIVDDKGIFKGVQQGDDVIGIQEWNKQFEEKSPK